MTSSVWSCVRAGKPTTITSRPEAIVDWDAPGARSYRGSLARDAYAILAILDGRTLVSEVKERGQLVAIRGRARFSSRREDGIFRIARRVAKDRVISRWILRLVTGRRSCSA